MRSDRYEKLDSMGLEILISIVIVISRYVEYCILIMQ